jgi:hypothetical protein
MAACARKDILAEGEVAFYHCWSRCVRRAYLCGYDQSTQKDYSHRLQWVHDRLEQLASCFAIEVADVAVMENHYHVVLRTRPDLVASWSDEEVVRRWLRLSSKKLALVKPKEQRVKAALADPELVAKYRRYLSSISRFMWYVNEPIARAANAEDGVKGRFFEERFGSQQLLDLMALLACSIYVDLNPVRAGLCQTPEGSRFTSAADRLKDRQLVLHGGGKISSGTYSGWLVPIPLGGDGYPGAQQGRRASDKGLFEFGLDRYLQLLDWTGRQVRSDKRGAIPQDLAPILTRLNIPNEGWVDLVRDFGRHFHRAAGSPQAMATAAARQGQKWFHGIRAARALLK